MNDLRPISEAPKDGKTIVADDGTLIFWSDHRICMLGSRNGACGSGWAVAPEEDCDTNLPVDEPMYWRPYE